MHVSSAQRVTHLLPSPLSLFPPPPQPFTLDETQDFLVAKYELQGINEHVLSFCHERSGGNPATLKRLVDSLLQNEILMVDGDKDLELNQTKVKDPTALEDIETPDSVRAFIRATMAKLSHQSLDLLFLSSTVGRYFSFGILEDAFKARPASAGLPVIVLKDLVSGGVLARERDTLSSRTNTTREDMIFYFRDVATMNTVYEMQSPAGRCENHLAVASALQASLVAKKFLPSGQQLRGYAGSSRTSRRKRSSRRLRRGSITSPNERLENEGEIIPKIAFQ